MKFQQILSGLFIFQLIMGPMAQAASGCGVESQDLFVREVVRQSYVYSTLQLRAVQEGKAGSCAPIHQLIELYKQNGGGMAGCQAIASCNYIKQFEKLFESGDPVWQKGVAGQDHCFRGAEVPVWEKTVCGEIEQKVTAAQATGCPPEGCPPSRANPKLAMVTPTPPSAATGAGGAGGGAAGSPPSAAYRSESVSPGAVSATTGQGGGGQQYGQQVIGGGGSGGQSGGQYGQGGSGYSTTTAAVPAQQTRVVYASGPPPASDSVSIDSKWLWGLGGLALGIGAGYLIWGNQYKTNYVPYYQQQNQPTWNNLGSNAWGQVPGKYVGYGTGPFGQTNYPTGYNPYTLGSQTQFNQIPGMNTKPW